MLKAKSPLFLIVLLFIFIQVIGWGFPSFTSDEARVAYRGYALANFAKDELGRPFPLLFNSLTDYQLPLTSYITSFGIFIFGKTDFGARIPFVLFGLGISILTYKISQSIRAEKKFSFLATLVLTLSPAVIFLSRVPNDPIVLTFFITLLFFLLTREKQNIPLIIFVVVLSMLVSKFAWFIMLPFVFFTLFLQKDELSKNDKKISVFTLLLSFVALFIFLQVPQSQRSLSENNFPLFSENTIQNGINKLRGQGIESGWPNFLERILFNKIHFLTTGFMHWLSNIQPAIYFGQFDRDGNFGFMGMGAFPKVAIIPTVIGIIGLIREKRTRFILYPLILTFPSALIYPKFSPEIIIPTLPFMAFVMAFGFLYLKKFFTAIIIILILVELFINIIFLSPQVKFTNDLRPSWIKTQVVDAYNLSNQSLVLISDDITENITPYVFWYTPLDPKQSFLDIPYPYKVRQINLGNIRVVGASDSFRNCSTNEDVKFFSSKRDLERINSLNSAVLANTYRNSRNEIVAYYIESGVCIN